MNCPAIPSDIYEHFRESAILAGEKDPREIEEWIRREWRVLCCLAMMGLIEVPRNLLEYKKTGIPIDAAVKLVEEGARLAREKRNTIMLNIAMEDAAKDPLAVTEHLLAYAVSEKAVSACGLPEEMKSFMHGSIINLIPRDFRREMACGKLREWIASLLHELAGTRKRAIYRALDARCAKIKWVDQLMKKRRGRG